MAEKTYSAHSNINIWHRIRALINQIATHPVATHSKRFGVLPNASYKMCFSNLYLTTTMLLKMKAVRYGTRLLASLRVFYVYDINTYPAYHMELVRYNFTIVSNSLFSKAIMA